MILRGNKKIYFEENYEKKFCITSIISDYCRMAKFSVSFIFPIFHECFPAGINNTGKNKYNTCPDLINTEKSLSLSINIYSLVYFLHKTGNLETE